MNERYKIIQRITKDMVGGVYLAEDTTLERKVAFRNFERVVGEEILTEPTDEFSQFSGKLTALQHPNLVTIYDIAFDDGEAYMVTQYVEDESLSDRLEEGPLPQDQVYRMAHDVLEALHAAHESDLYHGALNTQSIHRIPRASGGHRYLIVDMGLNHLATLIRGAEGGIVDPVLIAPEMHDTEEVDARSDLFMLGQLCYTALAGGHPFAEKTKEECARLYREDGLPPIEEYVSGVQEDFMEWVRGLAKGDPAERPADTEEAMQLLGRISLPDPEPPAPVAQLASPPVAVPVAVPATTPIAAAAATQPVAEVIPSAAGYGTTDTGADTGKKTLLIIISLVVIIGALAGYFALRKNGGDTTQDVVASEFPEVPDGVLVHMHSAEVIESEPIDLEAGSVLDWSVTRGVPTSGSRASREDGEYISNVLQSGDFKEVVDPVAGLKYKADDLELESKGSGNTKNKMEAGDGWEVYLRIPKAHRGALIVNYYVFHQGCGLDVIANPPRSDDPIRFQVEANEAGKSNVLLEIPDPVPGGFYTFKILAAESAEGQIAMGLSAIRVSNK